MMYWKPSSNACFLNRVAKTFPMPAYLSKASFATVLIIIPFSFLSLKFSIQNIKPIMFLSLSSAIWTYFGLMYGFTFKYFSLKEALSIGVKRKFDLKVSIQKSYSL